MAALKLSVLDQSVSLAGSSEDAAIRDTLSLAEDCERLGYSRFWLSEHHGLPTIVGSAPEILMAAIAARTSTIRIGSAGVMLPHYSALKVAEQFRVLEALAPGRIDLGVGRAPGGDMRTARALNPNAAMARRGLSGPGARPPGLDQRRPPCRHHRASARPARARDLDPRQLRLRRPARGALRPAVCLRLFLHRRPGRRAGARALSPALPAERAPSRSRRRRFASGRSPRRATRKRSTSRSRAIAGASIVAAASSVRCSRRRRSPRVASTPAKCRAWRRCARAPSSARRRRWASGSSGWSRSSRSTRS